MFEIKFGLLVRHSITSHDFSVYIQPRTKSLGGGRGYPLAQMHGARARRVHYLIQGLSGRFDNFPRLSGAPPMGCGIEGGGAAAEAYWVLTPRTGRATVGVMITSNAADHGPTCAETPLDHRCGDTEMDQGESWRDFCTRMERMKITLKQRLEATWQELKDLEGVMAEQCQHATPENAGTRIWLNEIRGIIARIEGRK